MNVYTWPCFQCGNKETIEERSRYLVPLTSYIVFYHETTAERRCFCSQRCCREARLAGKLDGFSEPSWLPRKEGSELTPEKRA